MSKNFYTVYEQIQNNNKQLEMIEQSFSLMKGRINFLFEEMDFVVKRWWLLFFTKRWQIADKEVTTLIEQWRQLLDLYTVLNNNVILLVKFL
jgi:hypothetical protein